MHATPSATFSSSSLVAVVKFVCWRIILCVCGGNRAFYFQAEDVSLPPSRLCHWSKRCPHATVAQRTTLTFRLSLVALYASPLFVCFALLDMIGGWPTSADRSAICMEAMESGVMKKYESAEPSEPQYLSVAAP